MPNNFKNLLEVAYFLSKKRKLILAMFMEFQAKCSILE